MYDEFDRQRDEVAELFYESKISLKSYQRNLEEIDRAEEESEAEWFWDDRDE